MSTLKLTGSSSGSTSLQAPASGSDRTITFPNNAGTVITNATPKTILQVVQGNYTNNVTSTDTSHVEISSDLRATITPISATSKLIITYNLFLHCSATVILTIRILKDGSTTIAENELGSYSSNLQRGNTSHYANSDLLSNQIVQVIDTAGNTSERYYTPFWHTPSGTRGINNYVNYTVYSGTSSYTVMEVAQ